MTTQTQLQYNGFPYTIQEVEAVWSEGEQRYTHDYDKTTLRGSWSLHQNYTTIGSAKRGLNHTTKVDKAGFPPHTRFVIDALKFVGRPNHKEFSQVTIHCFQ